MAIEIKMPSLAPSMTEGKLVRWLKREGDAVKAGEIIAEIETDKALVDYEAPADGVLGRIVVDDGSEGVGVDATIAWLTAPGEQAPAAFAPPASPPSPAKAQTTPDDAPSLAEPALSPSGGAAGGSSARPAASPLARRLAKQHGLSLAALRGSGPRGRIVQIDILSALQARPQATAPASSAPAASPSTLPLETHDAKAAASAEAEYDDIPHTSARRVIARRLTEAKQQVPHFYLTVDCEIDALLALRARINAEQPDAKISVNDFIVRAVAVALRRVPAANASWTETAVRQWRAVDVSVAVATPAGLITPVVRNADRKTIGALSAEIKELAGRAKESRLKPAEYQGGGFTVSNLGMFGVREFAAIVNPPQACILAVGAGGQRPVVRDGALAVATMMTCTLSVDHRVVDGAVGAQFLSVFRELIERPFSLLL